MQLIVLGLASVWIWAAAVGVQGKLKAAPELRILYLILGIVAVPVGALIALWLPEQISFNRESPAGIFYVYLPCFLIGGGLALGGIGAAIGSFTMRVGR